MEDPPVLLLVVKDKVARRTNISFHVVHFFHLLLKNIFVTTHVKKNKSTICLPNHITLYRVISYDYYRIHSHTVTSTSQRRFVDLS